MKPIHIAALTLLGAIWGASFIFIRIAAPVLNPLPLMDLRVIIGGLALVGYAWVTRGGLPDFRKHWMNYLLAGTLNAALPFTLIAFAQLTITASLASILNSTTPLFTALVAAAWSSEKLTLNKIIGGIMGIVGVVFLVGGAPLDLNVALIVAVLAMAGASFLYGLGTVFVTKRLSGIKPIHNSIGQLLGAGLVLIIPATLTAPPQAPTTAAVMALLALALLSTSFAYLLYFYLINNVGATRTASVTFLVPVFGSIWSILFLDEPFTFGMLIGMGIILASVGLVLGVRLPQRELISPPKA